MNYLKQIEEAESARGLLQEKIVRLEAEWVEQECPIKVGDTVKVNGYSFKGRMMQVDTIHVLIDSYHCPDSEHCWGAKGKVLKKDGTPGSQRGEHLRSINE